ncbi:K02A2.6-like, partial [Cordylochernes scorpioides]
MAIKLCQNYMTPPEPFFAYGQDRPLPCYGYFNAVISWKENSVSEEIYVIDKKVESLLGGKASFELGIIKRVNHVNESMSTNIETLVQEHEHIFHGLGTIKGYSHKVTLKDNYRPIAQRCRRIPYAMVEAVNQELDKMLENGIIGEVHQGSEWVSNIIVVPKRDSEEIRLCIDLQEVNKAILRERHPIPTIDNMLHALKGAKVFAKLDAKKGFWQVDLDPQSRPLTTFITHRGCYRFCKVPFGLSSAPEAYQKGMDSILLDLKGVICYLDDVVVYAKDRQELEERLRKVLQRFDKVGIRLNRNKCKFAMEELDILGHIVISEGIKPDNRKIEAVLNFPIPKNIEMLRSFLGTCGFLRKFIPNFSKLAEPLNNLTRKNVKWNWDLKTNKAFQDLKESLTKEPCLAYYNLNSPTELITDASPIGLGAVLIQTQQNGIKRPIAYASRSLTDTEKRYSQIEKETLGCVWAIEHFNTYIWGRKFVLKTDHKPLIYRGCFLSNETISNTFEIVSFERKHPPYMLNPKNGAVLPPRIQRLSWRLQPYDFEIEFIQGKQNIADIFSRQPLSNTSDEKWLEDYVHKVFSITSEELQALSLKEIKVCTEQDPLFQKLKDMVQKGVWPYPLNGEFKCFYKFKDELSIFDNLILKGSRILLPSKLIKRVLRIAHETHQGMTRTKQLLREKYFWINMDFDIENLIRNCPICVRNQPLINDQPLQIVPLPSKPWMKLGIDIVGPIGHHYVLTVIDYYSSYPEAMIIEDISSKTIIKKLMEIFARHGYPHEVVTDNGLQFVSTSIERFLKECGIRHIKASPYYPKSNGKIERFHRFLKKQFNSSSEEGKDWKEDLSRILMSYRTTPNRSTGKTPAFLLFSREIKTKLSSLVNDAEEDESIIKEFNMVYKENMKTYNDIIRKASPHNFEIGNLVYVANPNNGKLDSNFRSEHHVILENTSINSFKLGNTKNGKIIHRNAKHLKHVPTQETNQGISDLIQEESQENLSSDSTRIEHLNSSDVQIPDDNSSNQDKDTSLNRPSSNRTGSTFNPVVSDRLDAEALLQLPPEVSPPLPTTKEPVITRKHHRNTGGDADPTIKNEATLRRSRRLRGQPPMRSFSASPTRRAIVNQDDATPCNNIFFCQPPPPSLEVFGGYSDEDPSEWLEEIELLARQQRWPDDVMLAYARSYIDGPAKKWAKLNSPHIFSAWSVFKKALLRDFRRADTAKFKLIMDLQNRIQQPNESTLRCAEDVLNLCNKHGKDLLELARRIDQHIVDFEQRRSFRQNNRPTRPFPPRRNYNNQTDHSRGFDIPQFQKGSFANDRRPIASDSRPTFAPGRFERARPNDTGMETVGNNYRNSAPTPINRTPEQYPRRQTYTTPPSNRRYQRPLYQDRRICWNCSEQGHISRVSLREREIINNQIDKMLKKGIISHSSSPWASPVILVKKKDGTFRFCVDYRNLNSITVKDQYPLPRIDDCFDSLHGSRYFTSLDLCSGYWQVEVEEQDREKTAFVTPDGLYHFNVLPFGLCNGPATFERLMDNILRTHKWKICLCYLDDVIVFSEDLPSHLTRSKTILGCLRKAGLTLNLSKCRFAYEELLLLGHVVSKEGITPDPEKIASIKDFPALKTIKNVRAFLGLCSYYRRFIKEFSKIAYPLQILTHKNQPFVWGKEQESSFLTLKEKLSSPEVLTHYDPNKPIGLHTDASDQGLWAVLIHVEDNGRERPISYASRTLQRAETKYSTTEKECLAIIWAIGKFRPYLYGRKFIVYTDHHSLCWMAKVKKNYLDVWRVGRPNVQRIFFNLPDEKENYEQTKMALDKYFTPHKNVVTERFKFRQRVQKDDESIDNYLISLRELSKSYEFGNLEADMIRDQIIEKCNSKKLKEKLLQQDNLTLSKTIDIARMLEISRKEIRLLEPQNDQTLNRVQNKPKKHYNANNFNKGRFTNQGHPFRACRNRPNQNNNRNHKSFNQTKVKTIQEENKTEVGESSDEYTYYTGAENKEKVQIDGSEINMIIDTGSDRTFISYNKMLELYGHKIMPKLHDTTRTFFAYGQDRPLPCYGYFNAVISWKENSVSEEIYVIDKNVESLLGGKASFELGIIKRVNHVNESMSTNIETLVQEHEHIFHGLGTIKGYIHKVTLKDNYRPIAQRCRRIPYAMVEAVNQELDKMLENGIIEEVHQGSEWVSNIMVVPKRDSEEIRLCIDLQEGNKAILRERHPIPTIDNMLHALKGAKVFAKLDAKKGFWQVDLDPQSRPLTTFITHRGCYRFCKVPFGLPSAPEAYQKGMDSIFLDLKGVICYFYDVVVYAKDRQELEERLRKVLQRFDKNSKIELEITTIYDFEIEFIQGKQNIADIFSRQPLSNTSDEKWLEDYVHKVLSITSEELQALSLKEIKVCTEQDPLFQKLKDMVQKGVWPYPLNEEFKCFYKFKDELSIFDNLILKGSRILLPSKLIKRVLRIAHETHQGMTRTKQLLREKYFWINMDFDIENLIRNCPICVRNQPLINDQPLQIVPLPSKPWMKLGIDIVGPIGHHYVLTVIDYYSSYPEAMIIEDISSKTIIKKLMEIFARHGYPHEVVTDNGLQFVSTSMERFFKECGIRHIKASPYYPKSNGKIERFHRFLKKQFNSSSEEGKDWKEDLSRILMSYRTTPNRSTGKTPAFLLFSREIKTKLSSLVNDAEEDESNIKEFNMFYKEKMKTYNDIIRKASPHNFEIGNLVYVANPNNGKLDSNFRSEHHVILENTSINSFKLVNTKNGKIIHRNAKHLKHVPTQETNQGISDLIPEESQENLSSDSTRIEHLNSSDVQIPDDNSSNQDKDTSLNRPSSSRRGSTFNPVVSARLDAEALHQLPPEDDLDNYFKEKSSLAKKLNLDTPLLLEALTEGMPNYLKKYLIAARVKETSDWIRIATQLKYSTNQEKQQPSTSNNDNRQNFQNRSYYPTRSRFNPNSPPGLQLQPPPRSSPRLTTAHHQEASSRSTNLPPYPCKICSSHQLPNQYHFHRDCPLNKHEKGLPTNNHSEPPNPDNIPIAQKPYRTSFYNNAEIQKQITELLKYDIIRPSSSPYSSPALLVTKKSDAPNHPTRLCIDYRKLNQKTVPEHTPIPLIEQIIDRLSQSKIYTILDIKNAYWHIPIDEKDRHKTSFVTQLGCYEWNRLPYGLKKAPSQFERIMKSVFTKHNIQYALNYFDDIIIHSKTYEEHIKHLDDILGIFEQEDIKLNLNKCKFLQKEIQFLGYTINSGKYTPNNTNIEAILKLNRPYNIKTLQRFLGTINIYNKFIPHYAQIRAPLNELLLKNAPWLWSAKHEQAFQTLKNSLISQPVLYIYDPSKPCHLFTDASNLGISGVLKQPDEQGILHPIGYFSRKLHPYEQNYTASEIETLAIINSVQRFHTYIHNIHFTLHTDHLPLKWLKNVKNPQGRLFRWSLLLSQYDFDIKHIKGLHNIEADMLSRSPVSHYLTINEIKEHQFTEHINSNKIKIQNGIYIVRKKGFNRAYVPQSLRQKLLHKVHTNHGHIGTTQMTKILFPYYYWPYMTKDIANFTKHCETCQFNKSRDNRIIYGPLQQMPIATHPNHIFSLDTMGGLQNYGTTKHSIHMIVDHHSRFLWTFPTKSVSTDSYITCLKNLFQINKPEILITDRNAAFLSNKFKHFLEKNNVKHLLTSAHHPETNAKVERLNSTIINRLRCEYNSSLKIPWTKYIPKITESYNTTIHTITGFTPKFLYYGIQPQYIEHTTEKHTPIEDARKLSIERTIKSHEHSKQLYDIKHPEPIFKVGDQVLVKTFIYPNTGKLTQRYIGPFKILKQFSPVTYEIDKPNIPQNKKTEIIHSNKLKLFYPETDFLLQDNTNIGNNSILTQNSNQKLIDIDDNP